MDDQSERVPTDRERMIARNIELERLIMRDLNECGVAGSKLEAVVVTRDNCQQALPVILKWISAADSRSMKMGLVRILAVKWTRPAAPFLIRLFEESSPTDGSFGWAVGNSLYELASDSIYDDVVRLVTDEQNGQARQMLVASLGKMKNPGAVDVLIGLLDDEQVAGHAIMGLRKLRSPRAIPHLRRFVTHPTTWIRNEAKRAVAAAGEVT